jgi:hypothetical protein
MKNLLTLILILLALAGRGQINDLKQLHKQYIEYCNETVTDTIIENGSVINNKKVPIYGTCKDIVGYQMIEGDTTWKGYKCGEYKDDNNYWLIPGGDNVLTWRLDTLGWIGVEYASCKVTRKHPCILKREKPTAEGFYKWVYKQITK